MVNSALDADVTTVTYYRACHLGIAVDSDKGLMVPVIRNAQNQTISGLAQSIANAADRVRTSKIGADEPFRRHLHGHQHGQPWRPVRHPHHHPQQSAILGTDTVVERLAPVHDSSGNLTISVVPHGVSLTLVRSSNSRRRRCCSLPRRRQTSIGAGLHPSRLVLNEGERTRTKCGPRRSRPHDRGIWLPSAAALHRRYWRAGSDSWWLDSGASS